LACQNIWIELSRSYNCTDKSLWRNVAREHVLQFIPALFEALTQNDKGVLGGGGDLGVTHLLRVLFSLRKVRARQGSNGCHDVPGRARAVAERHRVFTCLLATANSHLIAFISSEISKTDAAMAMQTWVNRRKVMMRFI